jgi:hypothetical protein
MSAGVVMILNRRNDIIRKRNYISIPQRKIIIARWMKKLKAVKGLKLQISIDPLPELAQVWTEYGFTQNIELLKKERRRYKDDKKLMIVKPEKKLPFIRPAAIYSNQKSSYL